MILDSYTHFGSCEPLAYEGGEAREANRATVFYIAPFASSRITLILSGAHTTFNFEVMEIVFEIVAV